MSSPNNITEEFSFQLDEFYLDLQEDGSRISILDRAIIEERPFPGLRPFKTSEFQLFKGRDGQAEELIKRLKKNHFLAVIGSSGTGKSSLVRAGLIPQLFGGYLQGAGNKWNIAICRPGKDPVENLSIALSSIKGHSKDKSHIYENYESIGPQLDSSIYGILEVDELLNTGIPVSEKPNLLIIIDQFEELFRFDRSDLGKKNIENHFVNLLLKASLNPNSSVYVIITMRSEFLGDCVKYRGLPEAINEGQYLVPQLTRNQVKEVIESPINLAGKKIAPGLVELLINEIEESKLKENLDQLPILQHALMRTYQYAMKQGPGTVISYEHYKQIGEMEQALAHHAEAKYKELDDGGDENQLSKKQQIVKVIFQALTDASTDQKGGRRPTELKNIYAIAQSVGAAEKEVDEVVNHFRDIDTSFIMPPVNPNLPNTGLYPNLMMDISHESLMRNWERLNKWMTEEVRYGKLYKTLNERRELNEQDKSELIRGFLLRELVDWKARHLNNVTWAGRYQQLPKNKHDASLQEELYKKNIAFLEQSESASAAEVEERKKTLEKEIEGVQKEKWRKKMFRLFAAATVISLCFGLWAFSERAKATKSAAVALQQQKKAQQSEKVASEQRKRAEDSSKAAMEQRDSVILYAKKIQLLKDDAVKLQKEAERQKSIALRAEKDANVQKESAFRQSKNLGMQITKGEVQKESFYASNLFDNSFKDSIVTALFKETLPDPEKIPLKEYLNKYVNIELLKDVNESIDAQKKIQYDPVSGLRMANTIKSHMADHYNITADHGKYDIIERILLRIFDKNIFYRQNILPVSDVDMLVEKPSLLMVSNDASRFAFNFDGIITGKYNKDGLKLDKRADLPVQSDATGKTEYEPETVAIGYSSVNANSLLSFRNDGKVISWNGTQKKELINTELKTENIVTAAFSTDGKTLITVSKDGLMKSWNIPDGNGGKNDTSSIRIDNNSLNRSIRQLIFSPDSKKLIRMFNSYGFDVWNIVKKQPLGDYMNYMSPIFTAANFSPDGNYILAATGGTTVQVLDTVGKLLSTVYFPFSQDEEGYNSSPFSNLALSADWTKLLMKKGTDNFVYSIPGTNDSICAFTKKVYPPPVRFRRLSGLQEGTVKAFFVPHDAIISLSESGHIYLWKTNEIFQNSDKAFASIKQITDLTYNEKLDSGRLTLEEIIRDTNEDHVRAAAVYFSKKYYEDEAKQKASIGWAILLYRKLSGIDNGNRKSTDLHEIVALLERLRGMEVAKPQKNYDTILKRLNDIVTARMVIRETDSTNKEDTHSLANNYNDLAYYKLFKRDFEGTIGDASKGLELDPSYNILYSNKALAYLLTDKYTLAERIYTKYKDDIFPGLGSFKKGFLQDFEDLTKAGVILPGDIRVMKIKELLGPVK